MDRRSHRARPDRTPALASLDPPYRKPSPILMDCRTFREHHGAFLDDILSGADMMAMERHRAECQTCSAFDVHVRRGLMVLRSLPSVECSEGFNERLRERLRGVQQELGSDLGKEGSRWTIPFGPRMRDPDRAPGMFSFAVTAAAVLSMTVGAYALLPVDRGPVVLPPVVATRPAPEPELLASPSIVSSFAGTPVWPAMLLADEMPMRVAEVGFQLTSLER